MAGHLCGTFLIFIAISSLICGSSWFLCANASRLMPSEFPEDFIIHVDSGSSSSTATEQNGTRWAVLVAGSYGYQNYRHQADVCHAYQILKKGGLKDENIIVFMYDDIAFNVQNPRPGVIINKPDGPDVYGGVPKDYTGTNVTAANLYAVILGNKTALTGGSGKVVDSGPNDNIFIYYTDHGAAGIIGMPEGDYVYANDLVDVLKQKHEAKSYKDMVFYLESCESGSMFEGLLPNNISIYATTAANATENSWGTYCPGFNPGPPAGYTTCLGDLYSISWMEDCDIKDLRRETFEQQYEAVRKRTRNTTEGLGSHVTQYGNLNQANDLLFSYMGSNDNSTSYTQSESSPSLLGSIFNQRDADLFHFLVKSSKAPIGSDERHEAREELRAEVDRRKRIDDNVDQIRWRLFGRESDLKNIRPQSPSLVDDWSCFKMLVTTYEKYCGSLSDYGMQYTRVFANMCNAGVTKERMIAASTQTCS
ncbi:PREDICTED: vacuolar-processing enzyme [Prunus dulcis]|uniref:PREDICTED: vacuolar-processing enzyme n=1 Tax=Prunus dulcis TaxID=3755 RepID=A0A5E4G0H4_PRUDU|nr:vacuolar-processing enzyme-like [Prunus dulcis]VVA33206.1 PREDICTED: vacuolar-processing enzyme [Prunus dulcis]